MFAEHFANMSAKQVVKDKNIIYYDSTQYYNNISSYMLVDSMLYNAVGIYKYTNVPSNIEILNENNTCTLNTYCSQLLQLPLLAKYSNNTYVKRKKYELNRNINDTSPTFLIDIWYSCVKKKLK